MPSPLYSVTTFFFLFLIIICLSICFQFNCGQASEVNHYCMCVFNVLEEQCLSRLSRETAAWSQDFTGWQAQLRAESIKYIIVNYQYNLEFLFCSNENKTKPKCWILRKILLETQRESLPLMFGCMKARSMYHIFSLFTFSVYHCKKNVIRTLFYCICIFNMYA